MATLHRGEASGFDRRSAQSVVTGGQTNDWVENETHAIFCREISRFVGVITSSRPGLHGPLGDILMQKVLSSPLKMTSPPSCMLWGFWPSPCFAGSQDGFLVYVTFIDRSLDLTHNQYTLHSFRKCQTLRHNRGPPRAEVSHSFLSHLL